MGKPERGGIGVFSGVAAGISDTAIKTGGCARLRVRILRTGCSTQHGKKNQKQIYPNGDPATRGSDVWGF